MGKKEYGHDNPHEIEVSLPVASNNLTFIEAGQHFLRLALPLAGTRWLSVSADFVTVYMLSQIDATHLAASGIISVTNQFVVTTSAMGLYATAILQKPLLQTESHRVGALLNTGYAFAVIIAVAESVLLSTATKPLYTALGLSTSVVELVNRYFTALAMSGGLLAGLMTVPSQQTCYALNKPRVALAINISRQILILFFSYGLLYGRLGMPKCDIAGLAYARSIAAWGANLGYFIYFMLNANDRNQYGLLRVDIRAMFKETPTFAKKTAMLSFQTANEFLISLFNMLAIGRVSDGQLVAAEIAMQYNNLLLIPVLVAGHACAIQIGQHRNHLENVKAIMHMAMALTMLVPIVSIPIFATLPYQMASVFQSNSPDDSSVGADTSLSDTVRWLLLIVACNQVPGTIRQVLSGTLRGLGDFNAPMLINFFSMTFLGIGTSYVLGEVLELESVGFFLGTSTGIVAGAAGLMIKWMSQKTPTEESLCLNSDSPPVEETKSLISRATSYVYSFWESNIHDKFSSPLSLHRQYGTTAP